MNFLTILTEEKSKIALQNFTFYLTTSSNFSTKVNVWTSRKQDGGQSRYTGDEHQKHFLTAKDLKRVKKSCRFSY